VSRSRSRDRSKHESPQLASKQSMGAVEVPTKVEAPVGLREAPQSTVGLHGLCELRLVDLEDWPNFFDDMRADVEKECEKYGEVVSIWVDESAPMGSIWLRFLSPAMAVTCQREMDNRWFAGRKIAAELCSSSIWEQRS